MSPATILQRAALELPEADLSDVFDAEAIGAWRGFGRVLTLPEYIEDPRIIWVCLDNTSAIWGLRGNTIGMFILFSIQKFQPAYRPRYLCICYL